jgi:hypothetical protein
MSRGLAVLVCLVAVGPAGAQPPPLKPIELTLHPAAPPTPALKYRLVPELRDLTPGNGLVLYYRAFSPEWMHHRKPEMAKAINQWLDNPKQQPGKELRWIENYKALQEIDLGARRQFCDWEMADRLRKDGIAFLLPDIQAFRGFGNLLAIRIRFEIADGHYDKAAHSLQTGFRLARDLGEGPTLIQALVGIAIGAMMLNQVDEWVQTPGSPNLYWSLTNLPHPFVSLRRPMEGERMVVDSLLPGLREILADPKGAPLAPQQLQGQFEKMGSALAMEGAMEGTGGIWENRALYAPAVAKAYPGAKRFLLAQGWSAEQVEAMTMLQAVLMHQVYTYDRLYDEMMKWEGLPYWEMRAGLERSEKLLKQAKAAGEASAVLATLLLPAVQKVFFAQARLERKIAALRCVEALRLYAAAHDGKLPAALSDITEVPVPLDPVTGKAFDYKAEGDKATLSAAPPAGEQPGPGNALRYELTMAR